MYICLLPFSLWASSTCDYVSNLWTYKTCGPSDVQKNKHPTWWFIIQFVIRNVPWFSCYTRIFNAFLIIHKMTIVVSLYSDESSDDKITTIWCATEQITNVLNDSTSWFSLSIPTYVKKRTHRNLLHYRLWKIMFRKKDLKYERTSKTISSPQRAARSRRSNYHAQYE